MTVNLNIVASNDTDSNDCHVRASIWVGLPNPVVAHGEGSGADKHVHQDD